MSRSTPTNAAWDKALETRNPATGEVIGSVPRTSLEEINARVEACANAQKRWALLPRWQRSRFLARCSVALEAHLEELALLLTRESGKVLVQSKGELATAVRLFRAYAERLAFEKMEAHHLDQQAGFENDLTLSFREPHGVVALIIPFNFPVSLLSHKVAPALAMGNGIVLKPSEETPLITERVLAILAEALGDHHEIIQGIYGDAAAGAALVSHTGVAAISFTGSTEVGKAILREAAAWVKPVMTELGGNDAMIILADADLELAAQQAFQSRLLANGQCCCATKRIVIDGRVAHEFSELLADHLGRVVIGNPEQEGVNLGPLISRQAVERLRAQMEQMRSEGLNGPDWEREGAFCSPILLPGVTHEHSIARDLEIFAPVYPLIAFTQEAEAVAIANQSRYGLSGSVFSRDIARAMRIARRMNAGQVVINRSGVYRPDVLGFGGVKESGQAREGLEDSLHEYSWSKAISLPGIFDETL